MNARAHDRRQPAVASETHELALIASPTRGHHYSRAVAVRRIVGMLVAVVLVGACQGGGRSSTPKRSGGSSDSAVASPACDGSGTAIAPGETTLTMTSGGMQRTYIRHVPPAYRSGTPIPIVIDFHGAAEGAQVHVTNSALGRYGDAQGFATITPQGLGTGLDSY